MNRAILTKKINREWNNTLADYLKSNFSKEVNETIKVADEVVNREFLFRFPWDMEKTTIPYRFDKEINWSFIPFDDPEWCYMLNRHRYWISLGQAYKLTGDVKYIKAFEDQISHWIDNNPFCEELKTYSWRTIEAGIRCENWIKALSYFIDSKNLSDEVFNKIIGSLYQHGEILASHFSNFSLTSNWGIIENHGLYYLSRTMDIFETQPYWLKTAEERILKCLNVQVYEDGVHWEQSSLYHCEVLKSLLAMISVDIKNSLFTNKTIVDCAKKMLQSLIFMSTPGHKTPLNGDSDEIDIRELISEAAYLFSDPVFKSRGLDSFGYENTQEYGLDGVAFYQDLDTREPSETSVALDYSHNYVMRSSWDNNAFYLLFDSGSIGGGHGHLDLLHFNLSAFGRDFLTDSGRFTYSDLSPYREILKSCRAHNSIIIDNLDYTNYEDTWTYSDITRAMGQSWRSHKYYDYVEASHTGYMKLNDPVLITRKILFVKKSYWVLFDEVKCNGEHRVERFFQFGNNEIEPYGKGVRTLHKSGANLIFKPLNYHKDLSIKEGIRSPEYNSLTQCTYLKSIDTIKGDSNFTTLLYPTQGENVDFFSVPVMDRFGREIDKESAEAMKVFIRNTGEEHIIFIVHKGSSNQCDSYIVDDVHLFGEIVLIKRKKDHEVVIKIK